MEYFITRAVGVGVWIAAGLIVLADFVFAGSLLAAGEPGLSAIVFGAGLLQAMLLSVLIRLLRSASVPLRAHR